MEQVPFEYWKGIIVFWRLYGGAFSLARIRLSKIGNDSEYLDGEKGTTVHYIPIEYPAIADRMIVTALAEAAKKNNYSFIEGIAQSKDSFYGQHDLMDCQMDLV